MIPYGYPAIIPADLLAYVFPLKRLCSARCRPQPQSRTPFRDIFPWRVADLGIVIIIFVEVFRRRYWRY